MPQCIYLDNHATTPVDPRVCEAMKKYFNECYGNAGSANHSYGWDAEDAVSKARKQVADAIGAKPKEIIFTSGATESLNLAILGVMLNDPSQTAHFITSNAEHKATLTITEALQEMGYPVTVLPVDRYGQIHPQQIIEAITPKTALISLIFANNEVGTINPMTEIGQIANEKGIFFHADAAQAVGKIPIDVEKIGLHLLSLSGHKIYGPKGVGALYFKAKDPRVRLKPVMFGADQERGIRPGTLNVPGIVGLGKACEIANLEIESEASHQRQLRDRMWQEIRRRIPDAVLNGHPEERLPNNLNISIPGVHVDLMMARMQGLAVSSSSACSSGSVKTSHVLAACGVSDELAKSTLRFGLGRFTTEADIDGALNILFNAYEKSRIKNEMREQA